MYKLPIRYNGQHAILQPASRSGFWNIWPDRGHAHETMIPQWQAAERFPRHAEMILNRPDSSD